MLTFNKDGFTVEVRTGMFPVESWLILVKSLCGVIRNTTADNINDDFYAVIDFLEQLMPDYDTAKKMCE